MDPETIQLLQKAGKVTSQVRRETAAKLQKPGTSFLEAMDYAENRIIQLGGQIAWAQMAVNDVAAHFCPEEDDTQVSQEGQLIKVDIGTHLEGWIADNAMTVAVGKSSENKELSNLIKASQNALKAAIKLVRPGVQLWELGEAQYSEAEALGFTTVKNLCGHTIERYKVHAGISIPTYNNKDKTEIQAGWQVALEPFVTNGDGLIKEKGKATVFMIEKEKNARTPYARKILEDMKPRNGLPFTTRWLTRKLGKGAAALGLRELQQLGIVKSYPPLAEVAKGMVAQFEHSMIVQDKALVYTRHDDDEW
ncbi:MAG TPA: type II methionyl aminopeptidase [Candidatus Nanoarchaeia archaeon]|nr:type II methionyl aminopeptidase [Candidatus Nanoarchaeia archaeon]